MKKSLIKTMTLIFISLCAMVLIMSVVMIVRDTIAKNANKRSNL